MSKNIYQKTDGLLYTELNTSRNIAIHLSWWMHPLADSSNSRSYWLPVGLEMHFCEETWCRDKFWISGVFTCKPGISWWVFPSDLIIREKNFLSESWSLIAPNLTAEHNLSNCRTPLGNICISFHYVIWKSDLGPAHAFSNKESVRNQIIRLSTPFVSLKELNNKVLVMVNSGQFSKSLLNALKMNCLQCNILIQNLPEKLLARSKISQRDRELLLTRKFWKTTEQYICWQF